MLENEIWKKAPFLNERYEISNFGRIKSDGKFLKPYKTKMGYMLIGLEDCNGFRRPHQVHRLVGLMYVPNPKPDEFREINHIDGNKENNHFTNLEWCTRSHNVKHAFALGLKVNKKGAEHPAAKKFNQFDLKGNLIRKWGSLSDCAKYLSSQGYGPYDEVRKDIGACISGRSKTCRGFIFSIDETINAADHKPIKHCKAIVGTHKKDGTELYFSSFHDAEGFVTKDGKILSATLICACIKGRGRASHANYTWHYR